MQLLILILGDISVTKRGGKYCEPLCGQGPSFPVKRSVPEEVIPPPPAPIETPPPEKKDDEDAKKKKSCCVIL